jgi:hypothetical protein
MDRDEKHEKSKKEIDCLSPDLTKSTVISEQLSVEGEDFLKH